MAVAKTLEDIITEHAPIVCEQIEAAVAFADSEEDLRIEFEKAIEVFRKEARSAGAERAPRGNDR